MLRAIIIAWLGILSTFTAPLSLAQAQIIGGTIVSISDGDTVVLLDPSYRQHKIRLNGIDAPEKGQPFGNVSKKALSNLLFGKSVVAECIKRDRYDREVCKILIDGLDANLAQIREGYAWHYKMYEGEQSAADRMIYSEAEKAARAAEIGLWSDKNPQPPWEFRHGQNPSHERRTDSTQGKGLFLIPQSPSRPVKLSKSGICHVHGSSFYSSTVNFKPYSTLDACLQAGGRLPRR